MLALDQRDEQRLRRHADELASSDPAYGAPQIRIVADLYAALLGVLGDRSSRGAERLRGIVLAARREPPATPGFHALLMRILLEAYAGAGEAKPGWRRPMRRWGWVAAPSFGRRRSTGCEQGSSPRWAPRT